MTVTSDALDLLAGDPPRTRQTGDFHRHPTTGAQDTVDNFRDQPLGVVRRIA